ncbi:MAG: TolC family protein [Woeseiaceae bacterium]|nr:TolC family protein [Woeseiaceae bacterium]
MAAVVVGGGCAVVPPESGRAPVDAMLVDRGVPADAAQRDLLASLLSRPVSAESAVRIALINNPDIQSQYARLGYGAADVYAAGRVRNPVFSAATLDPDAAGERDQLTFGLAASVTDLITFPARRRLSDAAFTALQQDIGAIVMRLAGDVQIAWYDYVAAQQIAALRRQVARAGTLRAALAERFRSAGNLSAREQAFERAAASEARLQALDADAVAFAARTRLASLLGVSVADDWHTPKQLRLPADPETGVESLLRLAGEQRLDLAAAASHAARLADRKGVVNWTRWLGELEIGAERERESGGERLSGPTLAWEVPVFSQHRDEWLRADADLKIAIAQLKRITIDVDNDVRLAHAQVANARARIDEYRNALIPQRTAIVERAQEQLNYMLIGAFELLTLKQHEFDTYAGYLGAVRDYWIARAALDHAVGRLLPDAARGEAIDVDGLINAPTDGAHGGMDHSMHHKPGPDGNEPASDGHSTPHQHDGESQ